MGGYVSAMSPCLRCGQLFIYNPHKVPSLHWPPPGGPREPICEDCMVLINAMRKERGLPPFEILAGAYDAIPESEL